MSTEHARKALSISASTEGDVLQALVSHNALLVHIQIAWRAWEAHCKQEATRLHKPVISPDARTIKEKKRPEARHLSKEQTKELLGGRYDLGEELGKGGMGVVYRAKDRKLKREVAIKVILSPTGILDQSEVDELVAEARTMAQFTHPNVIGVLDIAQQRGIPYIVMEYIEGTTLGGTCKPFFSQMKQPGADLLAEGEKVLLVLQQYIAGVAEIHRLGRVHRDLKPDNGLVDSRGTAKVMDFGLAVSAGKQAQSIGGSPAWMSPEQVNQVGCDASQDLSLSTASDVYTLGRMLYWGLTGGEMLHEGETLLTLYSRILEQGDRSAVVRAELKGLGYDYLLVDIVAKCVHADPEDRYQSAIELLEALTSREKALDKAKWAKRLRLVAVIGSLLVVLASSFGAWKSYQMTKALEREALTAKALAEEQALSLQAAKALAETQEASLLATERRNRVAKHVALARTHEKYYQWSECVTELTKALEVYPEDKRAEHVDLLGPLLMRRGHAYFHLRDDESIKDMDTAASLLADPLKSEALFWALVFEATLDKQAVVRVGRVGQISDKKYQKLVKVYIATIPRSREERVAIRARNLGLLEAVEESGRGAIWYFIYAHTLSQPATLANTKAALDALDESIRLDPSFGLSYYNRAILRVRMSLFFFDEMKQKGVGNRHLVSRFLSYQEQAVGDNRMLFKLMPDWPVAKINFAESACVIVHFGTLKKSGSGPAVQLLEEAFSMIRPLWAKSDEELGEERFKTGYRLLELLLVKHGVCRRLGLPSREVNAEAHKVWNRLSRTPFTDEQRAKLAGAKQTFGFD